MKQTINKYKFMDTFNGSVHKNNFSYEGLSALFDYLESYEEDCNTEVELDVVAICCDFTEYANLTELQDQYPDIAGMDDLENNTIVIRINDESFIIQNY